MIATILVVGALLFGGSGPLEDALEAGDLEAAFEIAEKNLEATTTGSEKQGIAAFQAARIGEAVNKPLKAGEYYDLCADVCKALGQMPQSSDCGYRAGMAYQAGGRPGKARSTLEKALNELAKSGNGESPAVVTISLALAETYVPNRFDRSAAAANSRRRAIRYAQKALSVLQQMGQENSILMAEAYLLEARMYDQLFEEKDAEKSYLKASEIFEDAGPDYKDRVEDIALRILAMNGADKDDSRLQVTLDDGREVEFKIKKRRAIRHPRSTGFLSDGAKVKLEITLDDDGSVANVEILESVPDDSYGESAARAISTWKLIPTDGTDMSGIPPFLYEITYFLTDSAR